MIPSALPSRIAIHEAGHAVVYLAQGRVLPFVIILPGEGDERPSWGGVFPGDEPDETERMTVCVAGEAAELLAFGNHEDDGPGSDHDHLLSIMDRCSDTYQRKQIPAIAYARAEQILRDRWASVLAIAHELAQRKMMSRAEVEEVLQKVQ